jgi:hypothetical protein
MNIEWHPVPKREDEHHCSDSARHNPTPIACDVKRWFRGLAEAWVVQ